MLAECSYLNWPINLEIITIHETLLSFKLYGFIYVSNFFKLPSNYSLSINQGREICSIPNSYIYFLLVEAGDN